MGYQCSWERNGFVASHQGTLSSHDALEAKRCFHNDQRSDYAKYQIVDFSKARAGELLESDFDMACALDIGASTYHSQHLVAFVVSNLDILNTTIQYIEKANAAGCTWSFAVFTDLARARSWIRKCLDQD